MLLSGINAQNTVMVPDVRTVHVRRGDTLEVTSILLRKDKKFVPERNTTYYWFAFNAIQKNEGAFSGNLLHGDYKAFDSQNRLIEKGQFNSGIKTGKWLNWDKIGQVKSESNWKNGFLDGITSYYENGKLSRREQFKNGQLHGPSTDYNGLENKTTRYKNGVLVEKQKHSPKEKVSLFKNWKIWRQTKMSNRDKEPKKQEELKEGINKKVRSKKSPSHEDSPRKKKKDEENI